jgi:copper chaperone CopZ
MIRRQFIKLATLTGAGGLASLGTLDTFETPGIQPTQTVTWSVRGFTCTTCAVGLKVMLRHQAGVTFSDASYPNATVTIQYEPEVVSEATLRSFITGLGFTVTEPKG